MISQAVYNGVYTRFFDVIKRSQKFPFLFSFYAGGLTTVALWQVWIKPRLIDEEELCFPCVLARTFCLLMLTGTLSPLVSGPWLVHFMVSFHKYLLVLLVYYCSIVKGFSSSNNLATLHCPIFALIWPFTINGLRIFPSSRADNSLIESYSS
jgi:hypothetical protein